MEMQATEKQLGYIKWLVSKLEEKDWKLNNVDMELPDRLVCYKYYQYIKQNYQSFDKQQASKAISFLVNLQKYGYANALDKVPELQQIAFDLYNQYCSLVEQRKSDEEIINQLEGVVSKISF